MVVALGCGSVPVSNDQIDASGSASPTTEPRPDRDAASDSIETAGEPTRPTASDEGAPAIDPPPLPQGPAGDSPTAPPPEQIDAAVAVVEGYGYRPTSTNDIAGPPAAGLHVIIGKSAKAPHDRHQAFFFLGDRFVGTDLVGTSRLIKLTWRSLDTIALAYDVYRPDDETCCPTGGSIIVRYRWSGKKIVPLDPVPSAAERR